MILFNSLKVLLNIRFYDFSLISKNRKILTEAFWDKLMVNVNFVEPLYLYLIL